MHNAIEIRDGQAVIGGVGVRKLASSCGTPLYIYDQNALEERMAEFVSSFKSDTLQTSVLYASKAFSCLAVYKLCQKHGLALDVVSAGELYTAYKAGFDLKNVYFHGNNKSRKELEMALKLKVGTIIVDNLMEAELLAFLVQKPEYQSCRVNTLLRINPGIEAHTHQYIQTAYVDSKFGISILKMDEIAQIVQTLSQAGISFDGFHAHIGSQIFEQEAFLAEITKVCEFAKTFEEQFGFVTRTLDFGGGFGVWYTDADKPVAIEQICKAVISQAEAEKERLNLAFDSICIEPGRSIVAEAGYQLYEIGFLKETQNRKYIFIDGGMTDNIRPALYQADYEFDVATNMDAAKTETVTIAGKCCESGDLLGSEITIQPYQSGDLLLVHSTGAYGYSMASNYNKLPFAGVVFVKDGKIYWAIKPQSLNELIERELLEVEEVQ
ncbi:diaminopimelate decarboxylase [Erysipelotrichaceae bacterium RD49]|nr:diaminopimelate decarboxylase [Erysipelotrichaceae bacterium RD49]